MVAVGDEIDVLSSKGVTLQSEHCSGSYLVLGGMEPQPKLGAMRLGENTSVQQFGLAFGSWND